MKTAFITINGTPIEIRELTVRQIYQLQTELTTDPLAAIRAVAPAATTATEEQLLDMTPSQLLELWEQVKEVNAAFFALTRFEEILDALRNRLVGMVSGALSAGLSAAVTAPASGSTPGVSSLPLSTLSGKKTAI